MKSLSDLIWSEEPDDNEMETQIMDYNCMVICCAIKSPCIIEPCNPSCFIGYGCR